MNHLLHGQESSKYQTMAYKPYKSETMDFKFRVVAEIVGKAGSEILKVNIATVFHNVPHR